MAEGRALWQAQTLHRVLSAAFLSVTVLAVNLLGDGLRDALDPRMAKSCRWHCSKSRTCRPISVPPRASTARSTASIVPMSTRARRWPASVNPAAASRVTAMVAPAAHPRAPGQEVAGLRQRFQGNGICFNLLNARCAPSAGNDNFDDFQEPMYEPQSGADRRPPDRRDAADASGTWTNRPQRRAPSRC